MEQVIDIFRSLGDYFSTNISWRSLVGTYWYLFAIEIPRYFLLEFLIIIGRVFTGNKRRERKKYEARLRLYIENPLITVLAPGKNEGKNIFKLVKSLQEQTYKNYEIIIVDDGSDDNTPFICTDLEHNGYIDKYLRMNVRGGKASAANYGVYHAKGKYIVHLNADSSLDNNAIENILIPFYYDDNIKGVGGCIKVRNTDDSLCSTMQAIEYLQTIQVGRMVSNALGIYHIISGAFGAFEVDAIKQVGCWDIGPGLDGDITQKLRKAGYGVYFANDAICMTNVPIAWHVLYKQRLRWSKSLIRFRSRKHRNIFFAWKNFSFLNFFSNMENIVFDCIFNYLWLFYILSLLFFYTENVLELFVIGWIIRYILAIISFVMAMCLSERARQERKLFIYLPLKIFYTGYFLRITRLIAHTIEIFFFSSYKDPWNPKKTSELAQIDRI